MNDDDSDPKDDPNLDHSKLPQIKQSSYSGTVPTTDYSSLGGSSNATSTTPSAPSGASAFGQPSAGGFGAGTGFGNSTGTGTSAFGSSNSGSTGGFGTGSSTGFGGSVANNGVPQQQQNLTAAGSNAAQGADVLVANDNTDWINKKWRPVMGWMYMMVCVCDFTIFPILWSVLQALSHGSVTNQWQPLTLQGAGLFHVAMGAVLGIAAYGRTKEKVAGAA